MKKEVILVPKDKCPLNVLAEMGERIRNSWIFLHENAYEKLSKTSDIHSTNNTMNDAELAYMKWNATEEFPVMILFCDVPSVTWGRIKSITASDIAYSICPSDPEDIYFLKMDE